MHKNLFEPATLLRGFPMPLESSSKLHGASFGHLSTKVLVPHQRKLNHFLSYLLSEIISLNHLELNHFAIKFHVLSSNFGFPLLCLSHRCGLYTDTGGPMAKMEMC